MITEITMKKTFVLEDLDCANCAAKIENAVKELEHVISASVSFMTQKLVLEAPDEKFEIDGNFFTAQDENTIWTMLPKVIEALK